VFYIKKLTQAEGGWFEIDAHFGPFQPYLKMYVRGDEHVNALSELLSTLPSVRAANVTKKRNGKRDLTIYPQRPYKLEETHEQVELAANAYFSGGPFDPIFKEETISSISDKAYYEILDYLIRAGVSLEKSKDVQHFGEETIRGYLVSFLNAISRKHFVSGETFNKDGRLISLCRTNSKLTCWWQSVNFGKDRITFPMRSTSCSTAMSPGEMKKQRFLYSTPAQLVLPILYIRQ